MQARAWCKRWSVVHGTDAMPLHQEALDTLAAEFDKIRLEQHKATVKLYQYEAELLDRLTRDALDLSELLGVSVKRIRRIAQGDPPDGRR